MINKRMQASLAAHCGEFHEDDGVDPREFFRRKGMRRKENRKDQQLCQQVSRTLDLILSGELSDEALQSLQVVQVTPAPDASRLLVLVASADREAHWGAIESALSHRQGRIRSEVAAAVHRRKAPQLVFRLVPPQTEDTAE